jgi:hypothetical protein
MSNIKILSDFIYVNLAMFSLKCYFKYKLYKFIYTFMIFNNV